LKHLPAALVVLAGAAYAFTLNPSVPGGDSGELTAAACSFGTAHPPGYPLYTMLAGVFAHLPMGTPARGVNLLSALCTAGALALFLRALRRSGVDVAAAVLATGLLAFSRQTWLQAVAAEVFALHTLLACLLLLLTVEYIRAAEHAKPRIFGAFALTTGLGASHHHTIVFVAAAGLAVMLVLDRPSPARLVRLAKWAPAFLPGLTPYLYLVVRGSQHPWITWGGASLATPRGLLHLFLREDYGTFRLDAARHADAGVAAHVVQMLSLLPRDLLVLGLVPAAIGAVRGMRERRLRPPVLFAWVLLALYLAVFFPLARQPGDPLHAEVFARFLIVPELSVFVWAAAGADILLRSPWGRRLPDPRARAAIAAGAVVVALAVHFGQADFRRNRIPQDFGRALLDAVPAGAILLTRGDLYANSTRYLQTCEGVRPDLAILDQEMMTKPWMKEILLHHRPDVAIPAAKYHPFEPDGYSMRAFVDANLPKFRIFVAGSLKEGDDSLAGRYELVPAGPLQEIVRPGAREFLAALRTSRAALWPMTALFDQDVPTLDGSWERALLGDAAELFSRTASWGIAHLQAHPVADSDRRAALQEIIALLDFAYRRSPDHLPHFGKNLGLAWSLASADDPSAGMRARMFLTVYLIRAKQEGVKDPDLAAIEQGLR